MRLGSLLVVLLSTFLASVAVVLPCVTTQGCIARDDVYHVARSDSILFARTRHAPPPSHASSSHAPPAHAPDMTDADRISASAAIWNKMKNHVMRGRNDMPKSGRHTTSSFFAPEAKHAYLASSLAVNTQTSLAKSGWDGDQKKTLR
ncbi:hypothetical protein C8Q72DRAFT_847073 [Fomitopsis betulina]|nr:hypothetical protein C8Q72DRAFT_847073 [Fomitopsis betulina]